MDDESVGYLTADQFNRFGWAMHHSRDLVSWLRVAGYIKSADADVTVATTRDGHIGLPPTWLAADAISRLLYELNGFRELEDAANDIHGADLAVIFTREVETGRARWPYEDRPHYVKYMNCPECHHASLRYSPPRSEGERINVRCMLCAATVGEDVFTVMAILGAKAEETREAG
jgi:ribosomal protein S27E